MIAAQVVVVHLVSRSLRAFGVVSKAPFSSLFVKCDSLFL